MSTRTSAAPTTEAAALNEPADPTELHATHEGWLDIMDFRLKCYVLNDGQRVFDADVVADLFRADDATGEDR